MADRITASAVSKFPYSAPEGRRPLTEVQAFSAGPRLGGGAPGDVKNPACVRGVFLILHVPIARLVPEI